MKRSLLALAVVGMFVAGFFALTGSAVAQDERLDPDIDDFTGPDGPDVAGYLTASSLVADAPGVVPGQDLTIRVEDCEGEITATIANPATALGTGTCSSPGTITATIPSNYPEGFAEIIVEEDGEVIGVSAIYVEAPGTDIDVEAVDIDADGTLLQVLLTEDDLADTGRETLAFLGFGAAALMFGVTLLDGARRLRYRR